MFFHFNFYSSLLLPAFFQGLLMTVILFGRGLREERLSDKLLALLLLLCTIKVAFWMLGFAGWYDSHDQFTSFMFYFPFETLVLIGPTLYFYFLSLTDARFRFTNLHFPHFILPLVFIALALLKFTVDFVIYSPFPVEEYNQYGTKGPWADILRSPAFQVISYCSFFYYLVTTLRVYNQYQLYVRQNFSATESIDFKWIRNILYAVGAAIIIFFLFELIGMLGGGSGYRLEWYAYFCMGIVIFYVSISGLQSVNRNLYKLHFQPETPPEQVILTPTQKNEPVDESLRTALIDHLTKQKPYLEPDLSLADLAKQLNTNPGSLSRLINDGFGRNFNDFINEYRINELMAKLKQGEHRNQTLLGLALDSGFNSKATFNRAFKKLTSLSPKEWMARNVSN